MRLFSFFSNIIDVEPVHNLHQKGSIYSVECFAEINRDNAIFVINCGSFFEFSSMLYDASIRQMGRLMTAYHFRYRYFNSFSQDM